MKPLLYSLTAFAYGFLTLTLGAYTWPVPQ
jgi:hypothetical protein